MTSFVFIRDRRPYCSSIHSTKTNLSRAEVLEILLENISNVPGFLIS